MRRVERDVNNVEMHRACRDEGMFTFVAEMIKTRTAGSNTEHLPGARWALSRLCALAHFVLTARLPGGRVAAAAYAQGSQDAGR